MRWLYLLMQKYHLKLTNQRRKYMLLESINLTVICNILGQLRNHIQTVLIIIYKIKPSNFKKNNASHLSFFQSNEQKTKKSNLTGIFWLEQPIRCLGLRRIRLNMLRIVLVNLAIGLVVVLLRIKYKKF